MIFLLWLLNFGISWFNAWAVGREWEETRQLGGWPRFVAWCGAIMSGSGFTWCFLIVLALVAGNWPYHGHMLLGPRYVKGMLELGYVVIIFPILGSGIGITIDAWRGFARNRSLMNGGVAAWDTFAQIHNTVEAARVLPGIFKDLGDLFTKRDSDDDNGAVMIVVLLVILALVGGFLLTFTIMERSAAAQRRRIQADLMSSPYAGARMSRRY